MKLPAGWAYVLLGEMQVKTKAVDPKQYPNEKFELYSIPAYASRQPEVLVGRAIGSSKQKVDPGDVLLSKIVPHIRRSWVIPQSGERRQIASGEWIVFRGSGVEPAYLRNFLLCDEFHDQFMRTVSGVGGSLMRARPTEVAKIKVPIPPLPEQHRIVAKLEALTIRMVRARAEIDKVREQSEKTGRVRALLGRLEFSILDRAFRGELVPQKKVN